MLQASKRYTSPQSVQVAFETFEALGERYSGFLKDPMIAEIVAKLRSDLMKLKMSARIAPRDELRTVMSQQQKLLSNAWQCLRELMSVISWQLYLKLEEYIANVQSYCVDDNAQQLYDERRVLIDEHAEAFLDEYAYPLTAERFGLVEFAYQRAQELYEELLQYSAHKLRTHSRRVLAKRGVGSQLSLPRTTQQPGKAGILGRCIQPALGNIDAPSTADLAALFTGVVPAEAYQPVPAYA